jgi:uncharacterized protein (DUF302 family)
VTVSSGGYEFSVEVLLDFAAAEQRTRTLLAGEGFGVLTEIDVRATLQAKLGVDFRPYTILGACNPRLAHRALESEPGVGVLLPCNVVVEQETPARTRIRFMEPVAALSLVGGAAVEEVARDASARLHRVAEQLTASA